MAVILFLLLVHFPLFIDQLCCLRLAIYFPCPHTTPLHELLAVMAIVFVLSPLLDGRYVNIFSSCLVEKQNSNH